LRFLRFIFRNWLLKIGAILLAVILYGAMVFLQTTQQFPGTVAIDIVNQPANTYMIDPKAMQEVGNIRYIAAPEVPISQSTFSASIDLSNAKVSDTDYSWVRVQLVANDPRVQIIDYQPQQIRVTLDPVVQRQVSIQVDEGVIPSGLQPGTPVLSVSSVYVSGAESIVSKVAYAQARVRIDASGLDVSQDPELVARDASGAVVDNVTFNPRTVHVDMQVGSQIRSETVPVNVVINGDAAAGYIITSIAVTPPVVAVRGQADALALLNGSANTAAISISGATSDISVKVDLDLPTGVTSDSSSQIAVVIHLQSPASTRSVTVGVVLSGTNSNMGYIQSTQSVIVTLGGATAALNALDTSTLVANVSVGTLTPGTHVVAVSFDTPAGIRVVAISPSQITVTVVPPPTPPPTPTPAPTPTPVPSTVPSASPVH
jgi:YbbR domain-containing protein